jgi:hypothetical protein
MKTLSLTSTSPDVISFIVTIDEAPAYGSEKVTEDASKPIVGWSEIAR